MQPTYHFNDFINHCAMGVSLAYVSKGALETAKMDFNLSTQGAILGFIGNGGLEQPHFINAMPWENNPDKTHPVMVDAYGFFSGSNYGYIAFFFQQKSSQWIIKSFKKNGKIDPRHLPFSNLNKLLSC